jgi:hypothetical protein
LFGCKDLRLLKESQVMGKMCMSLERQKRGGQHVGKKAEKKKEPTLCKKGMGNTGRERQRQ